MTDPIVPTAHRRIKLSELDDSIFRPNDNVDILDNDSSLDSSVVVYTITGKQDELDEDGFPIIFDTVEERTHGDDVVVKAEDADIAYGKKTFNGKRYRYYVKANNRGDLYNPYGMYESDQHKRKKHMSGDLVWKFHEVNLRVFELYISFLKTNNKAWLQNAMRIYR